jgi:hypothetical protein
LLWLALIALAVWQAWGVLPIAAVEGDDAAVAWSATAIAGGEPGSRQAAYNWFDQAGVYTILIAANRIAGFRCLTSYAAIAVLGTLLFVVLASLLIGRLLRLPPPVCAIALLLFPEVQAGASYANGTSLAAGLAAGALLVLLGSSGMGTAAASGVVLGLAGWIRPDAVLMAPLVVVLAARGDRRWAVRVAAVAGSAAVAFLALFTTSGGDLRQLLAHTGHFVVGARPVTAGIWAVLGSQVVRSTLAFFPLPLVLLTALGVHVMLRRRDWRSLTLAGLGVAPTWLVLGKMLSTPKYLYYTIPALAFVALYALVHSPRRRRVALIAALLLAAQYVIGVRLTLRAKPWAVDPRPAGAVLGSHELSRGGIARLGLAVGPGALIHTDDGPRLSSGILFAPLVWHAWKTELADNAESLRAVLCRLPAGTTSIFTASWYGRGVVNETLGRSGFRYRDTATLDADAARFTWTAHDRIVAHTSVETYSTSWSEREAGLRTAGSSNILYVAGSGRERAVVLEHLRPREMIADSVGTTCLSVFFVDLPTP